MTANNPIPIRVATMIAAPIHIGERTHHQLQSIFPKSFKVIKTIASRLVNPIPLLELDEFDMSYLLSLVLIYAFQTRLFASYKAGFKIFLFRQNLK